jgi:tetratricopeptide (TPR) repeat protein
MRARQPLAVALALVLPLMASVPLLAAGGPTAKPAKGKSAQADGAKFADACKQGNDKYEAKDIPAAIELYKKATALQPRNPLGHYLLGEAQLGAGDLVAAEAAWLQAEQVADAGPPGLKAKVLFVIADLRERQKKWDDAKAAWQKYADFAAKVPDGGAFPDSAQSRSQMIDDMLKQDKSYEVVRQRIRDEDGGALGGKVLPAK